MAIVDAIVLITGSRFANLVSEMPSFENTVYKNPNSYCIVIIPSVNMKILDWFIVVYKITKLSL